MKVRQIIDAMEKIAPPAAAAEWDNVGLLVGDPSAEARKLFLCIDLTEQTLDEAVALRAGMVMAYHPVIFKALPRVTTAAAPVVYAAARRGLAVYSMHTALDMAPGGTNDVLADVLGLQDRRPLEPTVVQDECKIVVFTPPGDLSKVADAAFAAGAGRIGNYNECAFFSHGIGTFCPERGSRPTLGQPGRHEVTEEVRLEVVALRAKAAEVCAAIRSAHSYEEPALDVYPIQRHPRGSGMGRIGRLRPPVTVKTLIERVKKASKLSDVLVAPAGHPGPRGRRSGDGLGGLVSLAACCAGSCGSSLRAALTGGATFYLTGEMRHHEALEACAGGMTVVCLGHSNSERLTLGRLAKLLRMALPRLTVVISREDRDPFRVV